MAKSNKEELLVELRRANDLYGRETVEEAVRTALAVLEERKKNEQPSLPNLRLIPPPEENAEDWKNDIKAMVPQPDDLFRDRFHESCAKHFKGNYKEMVAVMKAGLAKANKKEKINNNKGFFMKMFSRWDDIDWGF